MPAMRLSLVVQVILAALTLGACLGAILPRLPDLVAVRAAPVTTEQPTPAAYALANSNGLTSGNAIGANAAGQSDPLVAGTSLQVQVRAEVQAAGNANAEAQALGPGDTQAKANTLGPGSSQAVAYSTDPDQADALPTPAAATQASAALNSSAATIPTNFITEPHVIVREAIVNLRGGPGTHYTIVGMATQGQQFTPVGRTLDGNWWKVCCYDQQLVWLAGELTDLRGPVEKIAVVSAPPAPVVAAPVATHPLPPPTPTVAPAGPSQSYEFGLVEKNQFAEGVTPRVFLYISQGAEGLGGYTLQVKKDNTYLPVNVDTFNGPPAFTWPLPIDRQRFHNLKVEFPGIQPAGVWEIQVVEDSTGKAVAAPVIFNLAPHDARQELYISLRR